MELFSNLLFEFSLLQIIFSFKSLYKLNLLFSPLLIFKFKFKFLLFKLCLSLISLIFILILNSFLFIFLLLFIFCFIFIILLLLSIKILLIEWPLILPPGLWQCEIGTEFLINRALFESGREVLFPAWKESSTPFFDLDLDFEFLLFKDVLKSFGFKVIFFLKIISLTSISNWFEVNNPLLLLLCISCLLYVLFVFVAELFLL